MNIETLNHATKTGLATDYQRDGLAIVRQVSLPGSFVPPVTDIVFLKVNDMCEVYIGTNTTYRGASSAWREIQQRPEVAGRSHLVAALRGDFHSGLGAFSQLLRACRSIRLSV